MSGRKGNRESGEHDYDSLNDTFYTYINGRKYNSSLILGDIILDLNEDNELVGFEILDASKRFGISKHELLTPIELVYDISISNGKLIVSLKLTVMKRNHPLARSISVTGANDMNLSPSSSTFALA
ncbi:DUF2283 domain-containing protein [Methanococcoides seepicolus]|jgi:uncharacterized protein YuzE|uniref:DUF2283 domain-containing protein n=1 Tax=Methanococcoides seepicolus TaxID=2828780 RepID=A0A9E4ZEY3_9EURY|nr:DUF2283 domain-containing protein [Methanococcoides seepicolus]MCM1986432.1 DUF2283 domain-containing protein [Methanococcoides seepicolus]